MSSNSRFPAPGRDKVITYRCNFKDHNRSCQSHEINRDLIEDYVIQELERHVFHDDVLPFLTEELNAYSVKQSQEAGSAIQDYQRNLDEWQKKRSHIIDAIATAGLEASLGDKLKEIESEIRNVELQLQQAKKSLPERLITEEMLRKYLSSFKVYIKRRNKPKIKSFIRSFVEKVLVYNDRIEVTYKVAFFFSQSNNIPAIYRFTRQINRRLLKWEFSCSSLL